MSVAISLAVLVRFISSLLDCNGLREARDFSFGHNFGSGEVFDHFSKSAKRRFDTIEMETYPFVLLTGEGQY